MAAIAADTHAIIWYMMRSPRLSGRALQALRDATQAGDPIYVSAISLVELRYLVERRRLPQVALDRLEAAVTAADFPETLVSLDFEVARAVGRIPRPIVPEMPDRIIAATALHLSVPLVTRDQAIQAAPVATIW